MRNGFFQVVCKPSETAVKIVAPEDGGAYVFVKELAEYLSHHGISYDAEVLNEGLLDARTSVDNEYTFKINGNKQPEIAESYQLTVSQNKMSVTARFYPPSLKGKRMNQEAILDDLTAQKITTGIKTDVISKFLKAPEYCTDVLIAKGTNPKEGTDARIEYYFDTNLHTKPTLKADGSVDFFHLNTVCCCKKGDVLARMFPEVPGVPGKSVYGESIKPRDVKKASLKFGKNITISEDKQVLTADTSGHVTLVSGQVFVANVLEVENVDTATGNINYNGSVLVRGNVCTNFRVRAEGNIQVKGIVEGAALEASGNIIIERGMNGMGRGTLKAEGDIISKFIENSKVVAGGYISSGSILHSTASAGTEIIVNGKRGFITGGKVRAGHLIQVKTLGSYMGVDTVVEVGVAPEVREKVQALQERIEENKKIIDKIHPILVNMSKKMEQGVKLTPAQVKSIQNMMKQENLLKQQVKKDAAQYQELNNIVKEGITARVEILGDVYAGTKITISDISMVVKRDAKYCRYVREGGDIKMRNL